VFTSGLVWMFPQRRIALFFTGCKHAGENLAPVLQQRSPELCRFVLETLSEVYRNEEQARVRDLSAEERLRFHQQHSQPVMDKPHVWLTARFEARNVEPNSGLGRAISYRLKHWEKLPSKWGSDGRPVHESDSHLRAERRQSVRLAHRVAAARGGVAAEPVAVDALALPRRLGAACPARGGVSG